MKPSKIAGIRVSKGIKQAECADALGLTIDGYRKKEHGSTAFSVPQIITFSRLCNMNIHEVNDVFFGGQLPDGNCNV